MPQAYLFHIGYDTNSILRIFRFNWTISADNGRKSPSEVHIEFQMHVKKILSVPNKMILFHLKNVKTIFYQWYELYMKCNIYECFWNVRWRQKWR